MTSAQKLSALLLLASFNASAGHTLKETMNVLKKGGFNTSQLYVKMKKDLSAKSLRSYSYLATVENASVEKLFIDSEDSSRLSDYQLVRYAETLSQADAARVLKDIYSNSDVEFAVFEPMVSEATLSPEINKMTSPSVDAPFATPDFESKQDYLNPAPAGVNARYAWDFPGGDGKNVTFLDIESGSFKKHEDLADLMPLPYEFTVTDHGTAVAGELVAKRDGKGVTGISYGSKLGFMARTLPLGGADYETNLARVISEAGKKLEKGDVLVLELHSPGPLGYVAVEYWTPIFDAIKEVTDKGILCVAAAGNGYNDLDAKEYAGAFDLTKRNSGCVIVGAALKNFEKADFSNYGSRVDTFGYGRDVVSTGFGDLFSGTDADYTSSFSGTSSATPIVSGSVSLISSLAQEQGRFISPQEMRAALRATGTAQKGDTSKRIGNLPDVKALMNEFKL